MSDKRKQKNGIAGKEKTKTLKELEAENKELKQQIEEQADALIELASIIVGEE